MRPEDQLQKAVVQFLRFTSLTFTATANGAFLHGNLQQRAIRGKRLKEHGVSNGVPDLLIFDHCASTPETGRGYPVGLAIELKTGKNKPTSSQEQWHTRLRACQWRVEVCRTIDEVLMLLKACYPDKVR